jgi:hypothetical protein
LAVSGAVFMPLSCGPTGEELEPVVGGGAGLDGVCSEGEFFIGLERHGLEHKVQEADSGVPEMLDSVRCRRTSRASRDYETMDERRAIKTLLHP